MASVIATWSEVVGECVERICVEVGRKMMSLVWYALIVLGEVLGALMELSSSCVDGNGARYWRLNEAYLWDIEEIEISCADRGFDGYKVLHIHSTLKTQCFRTSRLDHHASTSTSHACSGLQTVLSRSDPPPLPPPPAPHR